MVAVPAVPPKIVSFEGSYTIGTPVPVLSLKFVVTPSQVACPHTPALAPSVSQFTAVRPQTNVNDGPGRPAVVLLNPEKVAAVVAVSGVTTSRSFVPLFSALRKLVRAAPVKVS